MIIGLTGGMGCGKSTVARCFAELGLRTLDSDDIVRREILTDPAVEATATRLFGEHVRSPDGHLLRAEIARQVFSDPAKLQQWEDTLHPRLYARWRTAIDHAGTGALIIEVPLLHEKALEKWFDFVVCVTTTSANQYARLEAERGLSQALAEQRISKQLPLAQKIELADFVLSNDGSPQFLREQVVLLAARLGLTR